MNRTFKVIGRYRPKDEQSPWCRGKPGLQAKKRVYTSFEDFEKYSPETINRYNDIYKAEVYELI